mmetsp:Transcript_126550/g.252960  ORF Transcript_126550/g.252960 Transcript_126550/m.252960 type:complete len:283 (+) Transcript_126550:320-1168(+)
MNGTLMLPGMCPPRMPALGSGTVPRKRPAGLASTMSASCESMLPLTSSNVHEVPATRCHSSFGPVFVLPLATASSRGKPSSFHRGRPPSSTATSAGCPNATFNVYQKRGAENMPWRSYTTTGVLCVIPSSAMAVANLSSSGSMCGTPARCGVATPSMSKKTAPGSRGPEMYSARAPCDPSGAANGEFGRYQVASTMQMGCASELSLSSSSRSHSQETRPRSIPTRLISFAVCEARALWLTNVEVPPRGGRLDVDARKLPLKPAVTAMRLVAVLANNGFARGK